MTEELQSINRRTSQPAEEDADPPPHAIAVSRRLHLSLQAIISAVLRPGLHVDMLVSSAQILYVIM